jgi:hypothetical protein
MTAKEMRELAKVLDVDLSGLDLRRKADLAKANELLETATKVDSVDFMELADIIDYEDSVDVNQASPSHLAMEVQTILGVDVTGVFNEPTLAALSLFKDRCYLGEPSIVDSQTAKALLLTADRPRNIEEHTSIWLPTTRDEYVTIADSFTANLSQPMLPNGKLTWAQFTHNGRRIPNQMWQVNNGYKIAAVYDKLVTDYAYLGIQVTSGFRPFALNVEVGGSDCSSHPSGLALDITCFFSKFHLLEAAAIQSEATCIGIARQHHFIHLDARPGTKVIYPIS